MGQSFRKSHQSASRVRSDDWVPGAHSVKPFLSTSNRPSPEFYGGLTNLTAGELFFWIMIDVTADYFTGGKDVIAAAAVYRGAKLIEVRGKFKNATKGTCYASKYSRKMLKDIMLPFKLPTWVHSPTQETPFRIKKIMTMRLATFAGRTIPVPGWSVLAADVAQITYEVTVRYNRIVQKGDKLW